MRSITAPTLSAALTGRASRATPGSRDPLDRLRTRDRIESIARLRAAALALGGVDVSGWDDATLTDHLDDLSKVLCSLDTELARVADAVRARGFRIAEEPTAHDDPHTRPGAAPPPSRPTTFHPVFGTR